MEISQNMIKFVQEHAIDDVNALRLKYAKPSNDESLGFPIDIALVQIEARRKARKKLPTFIGNHLFIFPDTIAAEQASNEIVARFHASLLSECKTVLDLTAGLGIDDLSFAIAGINVTACEFIETKAEALRHNARILGLNDRITVHTGDSISYLNNCGRKYDVVFADPARRSSGGRRIHALADCQPDVVASQEAIMHLTDRLLIKCSPLLDLSQIKDTVTDLSHIHVICLKGECKEVLIDIEKDSSYSGITVTDLDSDGVISCFHCDNSPIHSEIPLTLAMRENALDYKYLYEPNAGVMKTGAWKRLTALFPALQKADTNTHLFLSDTLYEAFPGRIIKIEEQPGKKDFKAMKGRQYNAVARNHPLSASEMTAKHGLIPGGQTYLYAFRYRGKTLYLTGKEIRKGLPVQESLCQKEE